MPAVVPLVAAAAPLVIGAVMDSLHGSTPKNNYQFKNFAGRGPKPQAGAPQSNNPYRDMQQQSGIQPVGPQGMPSGPRPLGVSMPGPAAPPPQINAMGQAPGLIGPPGYVPPGVR